MLTRFKELQEAIKAQNDRYNMKVLLFEEEDYIKIGCHVYIIGVSLVDNKVKIESNKESTAFLGLSWLSDLAISKVIDVMRTYVK